MKIEKLNYKDILIVFFLWYFMASVIMMAKDFIFINSPILSDLFHYFFVLAGRFIFIAIITFYFISLYSYNFKELGLSFKLSFNEFMKIITLISVLFFLLLFLVNIPLSYNSISENFRPLYKIYKVEDLIKSLIPLLILIGSALIIAIAEQFLLNCITFELFSYKFNNYIALILASLFYSIILLDFKPGAILMNFLLGIISIFLYIKSDKNIYIPSLFLASYYAIYIFYVYGFSYIRF